MPPPLGAETHWVYDGAHLLLTKHVWDVHEPEQMEHQADHFRPLIILEQPEACIVCISMLPLLLQAHPSFK